MKTLIRSVTLIITALIFPHSWANDQENIALSYLKRFGYSSCNDTPASTVKCSESFNEMLRDLQRYFGLNITGVLDAPTRSIINTPRCSMVDKPNPSLIHRLATTKWPRLSLTYRLDSYAHHTEITQAKQIEIIQEAFNEWSKHTPLKFKMVCDTCSADIVMQFVEGDHGDGHPFDEKTLAHAFPPNDGRIHFDLDDTWTESFDSPSNNEINLFLLAVHEIGHALGLEHTRNGESIMYPTYRLKKRSEVLAAVDQTEIQALYDSKTVQETFGSAKYIGETKNSVRHGYGQLVFENGNKYKGEWKNNQRDGYGVQINTDGKKYSGEWKNHLRNGHGACTWANGNKYVGEWKNDTLNGRGVHTWANGDKYDGEWKDGKRNGYGIQINVDGNVTNPIIPKELKDNHLIFTREDHKAWTIVPFNIY
ncbi:unnamed protein product [Didymodactylos carnosus]|uniref:Peptidase metallopeptidase domain-containing protein n=1 Tax=Didymodactylos carnosus TaxID=1234261 RepID=A0A815PZB8_9BILA|nr:unnamed protein product [Didymodactylos carnosus]CAF4327294.1 unnamed protein product [Didymodactylos carnosus]